MNKTNLKIGVSSCLLGNEVRYDGSHKQMDYITDIFSNYFSLVPICPEIEIGMGVPREPVMLAGRIENLQMVGVNTGKNWTKKIINYSKKKIKSKDYKNLSGFILKNSSPSCGTKNVKLFIAPNQMKKSGVGLFAKALINEFPYLPVIDEVNLNNLQLRNNFIVRVFAYARLQGLFKNYSKKRLIEFQFNHKFLMRVHSIKHYALLEKIIAEINILKLSEFKNQYQRIFMEGLKFKTTKNKNSLVLKRILKLLNKNLSANEKDSIMETIKNYKNNHYPLLVPITLLNYFIIRDNLLILKDQFYLNPHPIELKLRNHV